jgi:hypothetical protein
MTLTQRAQAPDCPAYFFMQPVGIMGARPSGPICSRERQLVKAWARGASGRQKRNMRKTLRRMARQRRSTP